MSFKFKEFVNDFSAAEWTKLSGANMPAVAGVDHIEVCGKQPSRLEVIKQRWKTRKTFQKLSNDAAKRGTKDVLYKC